MSDKEITVEEMVGGLYEMTHESCDQYDGEHPKRLREIREAIRKHLTESDIAHWMDRCHELEAKLAEKPVPRVSREDVEKAVQSCEQEFPIISKGWDIFEPVIVRILTELDIEVSDNSEVRRRTSDKEGE